MNTFLLLFLAVTAVYAYTSEDELKKAIEDITKDPDMKAKVDEYLKTKQTRAFGQQYGAKSYSCPGVEAHSPTVPTSVHALRPGDIKLVATLGDSISAANGAGATNVLEVLVQYRGMAFDAGGDADLSYQITLPNVLRTFNPNLVGQSFGIGQAWYYPVAQLNVAVPGSVAVDLPEQAEILVKRLKEHTNVIDFENDWKLITIFIGGNDLCAECKNKDKYSADNWYKNIHTTIKILHDNIPRVMLNLVGVLHVELLRGVAEGHWFCQVMHKTLCKCVADKSNTKEYFEKVVGAYQAKEELLQASGEFERDDFTVVLQPFMMESEHLPKLENNEVDLSFFAPDCFHFSRKGHDTAGRGLWNNLVTAVGEKERAFNISEFYDDPLKCPDAKCPFLRTVQNSQNCQKYLEMKELPKPEVNKFVKEDTNSGSSASAAPGNASPALVAVVVVVLAGIVVMTLGTVMYQLQKRRYRNASPSTVQLEMS